MIKSMTSFGRTEAHTSEGHLIWEIRSVNNRYLEPTFRLPDELRRLEPALRDRLRSQLSRGKIDVTLKFKSEASENKPLTLNLPLIKQLIKAAEEVRALAHHATEINPTDLLSWPNTLIPPELDFDLLEKEALANFDKALGLLIEGRCKEGEALKELIEEKNQSIQKYLQTVIDQIPELQKQYRSKLETKIAELDINVDPERLEQELLFVIQKTDVTEELDRLNTHCKEFSKILLSKKPIGRRLDFLLQEMNREANTIGSKISDGNITPCVVEIKVLVEQIREQIQNIE